MATVLTKKKFTQKTFFCIKKTVEKPLKNNPKGIKKNKRKYWNRK